MKDTLEFTYSCGHAGTAEFQGSAAERSRALWRYEHQVCPECAERRQQEKNAEAAAANKAAGLPSLEGTERQIAWAECLRHEALEHAENMLQRYSNRPDKADKHAAVEAARMQFFDETSAVWFIENRGQLTVLFNLRVKKLQQKLEEGLAPEQPEVFCGESAQAHDDVVLMEVEARGVRVRYPKDEQFRELVKGLGYRWNYTAWVRQMTAGCHSPADVAAQTINALVSAGFSVRVADTTTRELVHTATWQPINPRVIDWSERYHNYQITTEPGADDVRSIALSLPRASERAQYIVVPDTSTDALLDFADAYGFVLSGGAQRHADQLAAGQRSVIAPARRTISPPVASINALRREEVLDDLVDAN